ncbi:MAG TPA: DUF222 domain-containing protein, partial [Streptosporangiaceae bacterium]|nr:DUF222 domain-containing protein [Streptosporangiaceae bacterium]
MSEPVSSPGPTASGGPGQPPGHAGQSWTAAGPASLSGEDLLSLLDSLQVAGTHDPEEDQEAVAAAEWQALQAGDRAVDASPVYVAENLPAGPGLAAVLAQGTPGGASDWDLPGLAAGYRRLAAWAQARELAAVAEIAARRAAANPDIGAGEDGRPRWLPPEAAAEVALELRMSQYGASDWTDLGCQLRWRLPGTLAGLAAGVIDLGRARIIAEATGLLSDEHAAAVEQRVLPAAGEQTTGQVRAAARRAVLAVDPEGAEQRRKDTERRARISLYPGEEGTATLTGSSLPGVQAAAAMARITALARALKASGAGGCLDLLRSHVFIGLLLDTLPHIPPPADGPPDNPPPPDNQPPADNDPDDQLPADDQSPTGESPAGDRPVDDQLPEDDGSRSPADDEPPADDRLAGGPPPADDQLPSDDSPAGDPPAADDQLPADDGPADDPPCPDDQLPAGDSLAGDPLPPAGGGPSGAPADGSPGDG